MSLLAKAGLSGVTLGVRVVIFRSDGAVFLVRHSYIPGWYFPGGGVDRGETPIAGAIREMREEAQMISQSPPLLHGLFLQEGFAVPDYVACYIVRDWRWDTENGLEAKFPSADGEILEGRFFLPDDLPKDTTASTRLHLEEILTGRELGELW